MGREKHLERYKIVVGCSFQDQIMWINWRVVFGDPQVGVAMYIVHIRSYLE